MTRVPASGPRNAKLMVVGMAPAKEEVAIGRPFVGPSGRELDEALAYSKVSRSNVFVTNVLDFPIPLKSSVLAVGASVLEPQVQRLWREIEEVKPNVILALGADPLAVLTDEMGIRKWRGSIIQSRKGHKMVVGMHPAAFLYGGWKWKGVFKYIDVPRAVEESHSPELNLPTRTAITGPSFNMVRDYIRWAAKQEVLSFDIETTKDYAEIGCVGIGCRVDEAMCIPFVRNGVQPYWSPEQEIVIWQDLAQLLQSDIPKVAQNASFEWLHFWQYGIYPKNLWMDTMTAHHCLYPDFGATEDIWKKKQDANNPGHALAFIVSQYTKTPFYKDEGRQWRPEYGDHAFWRYNCLDVMCTLEPALKMHDEMVRKGLLEIHRRAYLRPFLHTVRMEWKGVAQDLALRESVREELNRRVALLREYMLEDIGYELNVKSPKQMAKFLYEDRGYAKRYKQVKTPAGIKMQVTTDKSVVDYYMRNKGDRTLEAVQHLQQLRDLIGDILSQPLGPTGALHTHYKIGGTNGLRWSSAKGILGIGTNLQNIPRDGVARRLFLPS